jgi:hypothetical protein
MVDAVVYEAMACMLLADEVFIQAVTVPASALSKALFAAVWM